MMYVLINRDIMKLLHKHEDPAILANLAWIEARDASICIFPIDYPGNGGGLQQFTELELSLLFKNSTWYDRELSGRNNLMDALVLVIEDIPEADVFKYELDAQAEFVKDGNVKSYRYVKGSNRPAIIKELFN